MIFLQAQGNNGMFSILMMVGMIAVFYFFMIRPQQKKANDQKKMVEELKEGDEIVTFSGMHGKIVGKDDTTITISAGGGSRLMFDKTAISRKK